MKPDLDIIAPGDNVIVAGKVIAVTYYEGKDEPAELHIYAESGCEFTVTEDDATKIKDSSV